MKRLLPDVGGFVKEARLLGNDSDYSGDPIEDEEQQLLMLEREITARNGKNNTATPSEVRSTARASSRYFNRFLDFCGWTEESVKAESVLSIDAHLAKFFVNLKKENGESYEPVSIRCIRAAIIRQLESITGGRINFEMARNIMVSSKRSLQSKYDEIRLESKVNSPNPFEFLDQRDLTRMLETGSVGTSSPLGLLRALNIVFTVHFGLRGRQEHYQLMFGDVKLKINADGTEFLEFNRRWQKPKKSVFPYMSSSTAFAVAGSKLCPVTIFKEFCHRRPFDYCRDTDPMYIAPNELWPANEAFYKKTKMGENSIDALVKEGAMEAGVPKKLSNHSARKQLANILIVTGAFHPYRVPHADEGNSGGIVFPTPNARVKAEEHETSSSFHVNDHPGTPFSLNDSSDDVRAVDNEENPAVNEEAATPNRQDDDRSRALNELLIFQQTLFQQFLTFQSRYENQ